MKSFVALAVLASVFVSTQNAFASESLKCSVFYEMNYLFVSPAGEKLWQDAPSKVFLERKEPIVDGLAVISMSDDQLGYHAAYDGNYFRLSLEDRTNQQQSVYLGPSSSFLAGVDTSVSLIPAVDSKLKLSWNDVPEATEPVVPDSLRISYVSVNCNKVTE